MKQADRPTGARGLSTWSWIGWAGVFTVWGGFFYGLGGFVATAQWTEATNAQRVTGSGLAALAFLGPGVAGAVNAFRLGSRGWRLVGITLLALTPVAFVSVYWVLRETW